MSVAGWLRSWRGERGTILGAYTAMNVIVRGGLALLSLYVVLDLRLPAGTAAILLAYATLVLRFGRTLSAPLAARAGPRRTTAAGFAAVAAGYLLIAAQRSPGSAWAAVTLIGFGFGTCLLTLKVLFTRGAGDAMTQRLSYLALGVNVGAAVGPLAASGLATQLSRQYAYGVLGLLAAASALVVPPLLRDPSGGPVPHERGARSRRGPWPLLRQPRIVVLLTVVVLGMALYAQLPSVLPLVLAQVLDSGSRAGSLVGTVFLVNSVTVIALQVPLTAAVRRVRLLRRLAVAAAMALYAAGFAVLLVAGGLAAVLVGVLFMSIAECLLLPIVETDLAAGVDADGLLTLFALSALAMGVGEAGGTLVGVAAAARGPAATHVLLGALVAVALAAGVLDATLSRWLHALTVLAPDAVSAQSLAGPPQPRREDDATRARSGPAEGP